jgi:hypothetical protein
MEATDEENILRAYECINPDCGARWGAWRAGKHRRTCLRCGNTKARSLGSFTNAKLRAGPPNPKDQHARTPKPRRSARTGNAGAVPRPQSRTDRINTGNAG